MTSESANAWVLIIGALTPLGVATIGLMVHFMKREVRETAKQVEVVKDEVGAQVRQTAVLTDKIEVVHGVVNNNLAQKEGKIQVLEAMLLGKEQQAIIAEQVRKILADETAALAARRTDMIHAATLEAPLPVEVITRADAPLPVVVVEPTAETQTPPPGAGA